MRAADLGRGIPEDFFFYLRLQSDPKREHLEPSLDRAVKAAKEAVLNGDSLQLLFDLLGQKVTRQEAAQWRRLLEGIDWGKLCGREWAFGARFEISVLDSLSLDSNSRVDWIALFRVDPAERDPLIKTLRKLVLAFSTLEERSEAAVGGKTTFEVVDAERDGVPLTILKTQEGETRLCVGGQGNVIAAASSAWELRRSFKLLQGEGIGLGVGECEDHSRLMAGLPAPGAGEMLLRPGLIFDQLKVVAKAVAEAPVRNQRVAQDVDEVVRMLGGIVDGLDLVQGAAVTGSLKEGRLVETCRIELREDASGRILYPAFFDRPSLGEFSRMVPRGAVGFTVTSGVDLVRLHDGLVELVKKVLPEGRLLIDEYRRYQERAGLDLKKDLLSLIDGRAVLLSFPPRAGGEANDRVLFVKLKDPARAEAKLGEWLSKSEDSLKAFGMGPEKVELPGVSGTFHRMTLPFPPGLEVTYGVSGEEFSIGTSRDRLREALLVRRGEVEDILGDPSFKGLEVVPSGDPGIVLYRDLRDLSREALQGLKGIGAMAAMIPDGAEGKQTFLKKLLLLGPRLEPVIRALDFAELFGGHLSRDGKSYLGKFVVTLRPPGETPPGGPAEKKDEKKSSETKRRTF